jgi:signal transduction histidine kinase/ligand-binding sensor domain-containing protein
MAPRWNIALLAACAWPAMAMPAALPIDDKHNSWSVEQGAPGRINALAQGRDGYLWIGGVEGLTRFDGVSFEPVDAAASGGSRFVVSALHTARNGDIWIGRARSGGSWVFRGDRLIDTHMPNPSREVNGIAEAPDGAIWVARGGRNAATLARYAHGRWEEIGPRWRLPQEEIWQLLFARDGTLWVVLGKTLAILRPGSHSFEPTGIAVQRRAGIAEDRSGTIWLSDAAGTRPLSPGKASQRADSPHRSDATVGGVRIIADRRGKLWGATWNDGLFRIGQPAGSSAGRQEAFRTFRKADGLTSDQSRAVLEDREGNVWIGTEMGLDMFRHAAVRAEARIPGNPSRGFRMAPARDGSVYVADNTDLYRIAPGGMVSVAVHLPEPVGSVCAGVGSGVWMTFRDYVLHVDGTHVTRLPKPPLPGAFGCVEDRDGRLWIAALNRGIYWHDAAGWHLWRNGSAQGLPANTAPMPGGRAAILFRADPKLASQPPFEPIHAKRAGVGGIEGLFPGSDAFYVSGAQGMARFAGDTRRTLSGKTYPWLASVNGLVQTAAGDTWTIGDGGITRMASRDLDRAFDRPGAALPHRAFDFRDGLGSFAQKSPGPQAAVGGDGRIWFLTRGAVVSVDPADLAINRVPPPVSIRSLDAGDRHYAGSGPVRLPAGTTSLVINYTALSLSVPSRVHFRTKLEGFDKGWEEAEGRRTAIYGNLSPGTYRFSLVAANDDGVWSSRPAMLSIEIPPTLTQTWTFRIACIAAALLLGWLLYSLRLRQVSGQLRARLAARGDERDRIARELHDTLLQGVQGLLMRFQSIADGLGSEDPARSAMNGALDRAEQLLIDGRDRVSDLRTRDPRPLEDALKDLAHEQPFPAETVIDVTVEGSPALVDPVVLDEIARIAGEALFNAARHALAARLEIHIAYGRTRLEIAVLDDGVGVDAERLMRAGREGHYGLIGMHERARKIGANLEVGRRKGRGTSVRLIIPAAAAYRPPTVERGLSRRWRNLFGG